MTTLNTASLRTALSWLRHQELRAIITNLDLGRGSDDNSKTGWIETLLHLWATPQAQARVLDRLSPAALVALHRLCIGGTLPATLFWATYGSRGWEDARDTQTIGDGALWIWNLADEYFPRSLRTLDWYHGSEYLHNAARCLFLLPQQSQTYAIYGVPRKRLSGAPGARLWYG